MNEPLRVPKHSQEGKDKEWEALRKEYAQLRSGYCRAREENARLKRCLFSLTLLVQDTDVAPEPELEDPKEGLAGTQPTMERSEKVPSPLLDLDLDDPTRPTSENKFVLAYDMAVHTGPVYASRFSPCGSLLASGAGDCRTSLYSVGASQVVHVLAGHQAGVSDVTWGLDSQSLVTVALERGDSAALLWDVCEAKVSRSFSGQGACMLAAQVSPTDPHTFLACDSKDHVLIFDCRQPLPAAVLCNDCIVYSLDVEAAGDYFVTGDQRGRVTFWDLRRYDESCHGDAAVVSSDRQTQEPEQPQGEGQQEEQQVQQQQQQPPHQQQSQPQLQQPQQQQQQQQPPQSHQQPQQQPQQQQPFPSSPAVLHQFPIGPEGAPLSYVHMAKFGPGNVDNGRFLAVNSYDNVLRVYDRGSLINTSSLAFRLRHQLYGHKNKNHSIKSSFFCGSQYSRQVQPSTKDEAPEPRSRSLDSSFLLATGSSDGFAYVYDISSTEVVANRLLQKLGAHKDVVYGVTFHPHLPVMATYSKDMTVKIWASGAPKAG